MQRARVREIPPMSDRGLLPGENEERRPAATAGETIIDIVEEVFFNAYIFIIVEVLSNAYISIMVEFFSNAYIFMVVITRPPL